MGRASEIAKEIEIYEGTLNYAEVKNDPQKKEDIENKIKSLRSSLIATAKDLNTDDFSRKDQSDLTFIRSQLGEIHIFEGGTFEITNIISRFIEQKSTINTCSVSTQQGHF